MSGRREVFIGPRRRATITHRVNGGETWHGRRGKMTMYIHLSDQPTLDGERVSFACTIYGNQTRGQAGSVTDAIERMETIYRERTLQRAPEPKPKRRA